MEILIILLLSTFMCFFVNSIFRFNRMIFILLSSVLVFLFVSFFIVFLGFEFLILIFVFLYSAALMFLSLFLNADFGTEKNVKELIFKNKNIFFKKINFFIGILNLICCGLMVPGFVTYDIIYDCGVIMCCEFPFKVGKGYIYVYMYKF